MPPLTRFPTRRGVTLLELAIVLTIMGVAAVLVAPMLRPPVASGAERSGQITDVVTSARRQAIRRAEPLRLRTNADGAWTLASMRDGVVIESGMLTPSAAPTARLDLQIDALGGCVPTQRVVSETAFDPMQCHIAERAP